MKVYWLLSNFPHAANKQSGVFYKIFAAAMMQQPIELTVIAPVPYTFGLLSLFSKKYRAYRNAPYVEHPMKGLTILRPRYFSLPRASDFKIVSNFMERSIRKLQLPRPDIIHGFGAYPFSYVATVVAKKFNCPCTITFIGSDVNEFPLRSNKAMSFFLKTIENSTQVITVSKALAEKVLELSKRSAKVLHIPIGIDSGMIRKSAGIREKFRIGQEKFVVLFVGALNKSKGIVELCNALTTLQMDTKIQGVFAGPSGDATPLVQAQTNAHWLGAITHAEVIELMSVCDVLVLPSYMEGIPGAIKEAGQMQLPVIASNVGGIPEIIDATTGILLQENNTQTIASAIKEVISNPAAAEERAAHLKSRIEKMFHPAAIAQEQMNVYSQLIGKRKV